MASVRSAAVKSSAIVSSAPAFSASRQKSIRSSMAVTFHPRNLPSRMTPCPTYPAPQTTRCFGCPSFSQKSICGGSARISAADTDTSESACRSACSASAIPFPGWSALSEAAAPFAASLSAACSTAPFAAPLPSAAKTAAGFPSVRSSFQPVFSPPVTVTSS